MTTTHNSLVRLTPREDGKFDLNGHLQGKLLIEPTAGGSLDGSIQAEITGIAECFRIGLNPCATFLISVDDSGNWNVPSVQAKGSLFLSIGGVVGVPTPMIGGGGLSGTIHFPK